MRMTNSINYNRLAYTQMLNNNYTKRSFCTPVKASTSGSGDKYVNAHNTALHQETDPSSNTGHEDSSTDSYFSEDVMRQLGYTEEDIAAIRGNDNARSLSDVTDYLTSKFEITPQEAKDIVLKYPRFLNTTNQQIEDRIKLYMDLGIAGQDLSIEEITDVFKANPFYLLCPINSYPRIVAELKKYRFTKEETFKVFKEAPGILGFQKTAINGLFDQSKFKLG